MTKNKTISYGQKISSRLQNLGWEFERIEPENQWYATEHWLFSSRRQAYGTRIFISFIVDPQSEIPNTTLCVRAGTNIPTYFHHSDGEIAELYMSRGMFRQKLDAFIGSIEAHRNQVHLSTQKEDA